MRKSKDEFDGELPAERSLPSKETFGWLMIIVGWIMIGVLATVMDGERGIEVWAIFTIIVVMVCGAALAGMFD